MGTITGEQVETLHGVGIHIEIDDSYLQTPNHPDLINAEPTDMYQSQSVTQKQVMVIQMKKIVWKNQKGSHMAFD